jgi:hypothetical protein
MGSFGRCVVVGVAFALYVAALFLPTASPFKGEFSATVFSGGEAFELGLRALLSFMLIEREWWIVSGACLANPLVWTTGVAIYTERQRLAVYTSCAAVVLCLAVLIEFGNILVGHPGYWCWLASAVVLAVGSCMRLWRGDIRARWNRAREHQSLALDDWHSGIYDGT